MLERALALGPIRKAGLLSFAAASIMIGLAGCGGSSSTATQVQATPTATTGAVALAACAPASTDGRGGPYPAAESSDCTGRKTVEIDVVDDPKTVGGFAPSNVTITRGTVVAFVWKSSGHNLSPFHTDIEDTGYVFRKTFDQAGSFDFSCQVHPGQNGVIFVR